MTPRWTLYSCFYDCKSFSDAIEVRKVYTNIACNFRDGPLICEYRTSSQLYASHELVIFKQNFQKMFSFKQVEE